MAQMPQQLDPIRHRAGAVVSTREGRPVVLNYGSAAGELALCVRAVGLADRCDLSVLALRGPAEQLGPQVARLAGRALAPGECVRSAGASWCAPAADEALAICDAHTAVPLSRALREAAGRSPELVLEDRSERDAAIGLAGRAAPALLAALGVANGAGVVRAPLGDVEALWLRESDQAALALVPRAHADEAWHAIERAGRPFALGYVGREALDRYAVLARAGAPRI